MSKAIIAKETPVIRSIQYFSFFSYAPTLIQIHTFLSRRATKGELRQVLNRLVKEKKLISYKYRNVIYYTMPPHRIYFKQRVDRIGYTKKKLKRVKLYFSLLSKLPQISLVGLSGSAAMDSVKRGDDIDLFIITSRSRLWTGRFLALGLAQIFGLRRKRGDRNARNKVCINLLFDESDLKVHENKRNEYVAHEVLQMRPMFMQVGVYESFIKRNSWVFRYFPNAGQYYSTKTNIRREKKGQNIFGDILEKALKRLQLFIINKHKTNERITETQLWFFPDDFEKKLREAGII